MKKTLRSIIAVLLCFMLLASSSGAVLAVAAAEGGDTSAAQELSAWDNFINTVKRFFARIINFISNLFINDIVAGGLVAVVPDGNSVAKMNDFNLDEYADFFPGMSEFLSEPAEGAVWSLGYSEHSIMPEDFGEKEYAKGAYLPYVFGNAMYKDDDGTDEELRVRVIVLNDGSGRGNVAFAAVDAMGLCNADVRLIRAALKDFAVQNNIVSLNVDCTHIHTGIDSQGVWTDPAGVLFKNITSSEAAYGVDRTFMKAIVEGTYAAVTEAFANMTAGKLFYSKTDISEYIHDRTAPIAIDENLYKLEFVPFSETAKPTIIATFGVHPESSSYDWNCKVDENGKEGYDKEFTPDFIWYMEKLMNLAGYNFIYLQGNVSTTTSSRGLSNDNGLDFNAHESAVRYGYELGYITLTLSMTEEERIAVNAATGDRLGIAQYAETREGYTKWYDGLETVAATEVEPLLNISNRQFTVQISNNAMAAIGKTGISDNYVLKDGLKYYTVSEVGYMEIGKDTLKVYMSPGETFTELLKGGYGADNFSYSPLRETYGDNLIIMDLMNDAAGYVANDDRFVMVGLQYNEETGELEDDTWCIISYGHHAASSFIGEFTELVKQSEAIRH